MAHAPESTKDFMNEIYVSASFPLNTVFSIGPSSRRILHDTGREMEDERVFTICQSFVFNEDTSQATSGDLRSADPMFPCSENCFGQPMLISIAETSFSLRI